MELLIVLLVRRFYPVFVGRAGFYIDAIIWSVLLILCWLSEGAYARDKIVALYLPLADHYAGVVAYERYRKAMIYADFDVVPMGSWDQMRAYFREGRADMAFIMGPLAIDMYRQQADFRWLGLTHRDGSALTVNGLLAEHLNLSAERGDSKSGRALADALIAVAERNQHPLTIGVPHILSTHSIVLHWYLQSYGIRTSIIPDDQAQVQIRVVSSVSPGVYLRRQQSQARAAAFEQSLPWAAIAESDGVGNIAWYSKDILIWPGGHIDGIAVATNQAIANKASALQEVMYYIQKAGADIEQARRIADIKRRDRAMSELIELIQRHMPNHSAQAIRRSLAIDINVINYQHLNVDKDGLTLIMNLGLEAGILTQAININEFADERFAVDLDDPHFIEHIPTRHALTPSYIPRLDKHTLVERQLPGGENE